MHDHHLSQARSIPVDHCLCADFHSTGVKKTEQRKTIIIKLMEAQTNN
jgi:hypothetical protein